tara:strand:+ start:282 stop:572 length:291 start_codon:yes stop_codon:yes gene_type:complete
MPLYATLHTDYVAGENGNIDDVDDPTGTRLIEAPNAEAAMAESCRLDLAEEGSDIAGVPLVYQLERETAVINLDLIFAAMREKGYTVTVFPPKEAA